MTEKKQELEKCLKLSRKLRKEINSLTEWLAATDVELTKRSAVQGMPSNLDAEIAWGKVTMEHTMYLYTSQFMHIKEGLIKGIEILVLISRTL